MNLLLALHLHQQTQKLLKEYFVLANDAPRILVAKYFLINALNLQLLDIIVNYFVVVDAFAQWAFHGDNLELADAQVEGL